MVCWSSADAACSGTAAGRQQHVRGESATRPPRTCSHWWSKELSEVPSLTYTFRADDRRAMSHQFSGIRGEPRPAEVRSGALPDRPATWCASNFSGLDVTEDPGLQFLIHTTEPGSTPEERMRLLGSWAVDQPWARQYESVLQR